MSIRLEEQSALLDALPEHAASLLRDNWSEATRTFSGAGLRNYLRGVEAFNDLGRNENLLLSYIEKAPQLARAVGEDCVPLLIEFILAMASKTSGEVLGLLVDAAPGAAARLGDIEVFTQFLDLMSHVAATAPRGMRPLLEHLDRLFGQLTLGGLRRWVQWGLKTYANDIEGQHRYFSLQSPDALSVLQRERKGTVFIDVQRRLNMYLRAIWGRDFFMRPTAGDYENREGLRPYIERYVIHIADAYDDYKIGEDAQAGIVSGVDIYRAAANHCAAHLVFTREPMPSDGLSALERAVCELIEDARVEALACARYPNMRNAWLALHPAPVAHEPQTPGELLHRLAYGLLDPGYEDSHAWVADALARFRAWPTLEAGGQSLTLGVQLAAALAEFGLPPYHAERDRQRAIYRDDNRFIWSGGDYDTDEALMATWEPKQQRRDVNVMEMVNAVDVEFAGDDAQEIWVLGTEFMLDDGTSLNELEGGQATSMPVHYHEWDYQIQLERPEWATVIERRPAMGDLDEIERTLDTLKPTVSRLRHKIEALVPQGMQRIRHLEDGDDLDIDAAVRAMIDLRSGRQPDPRVMMRNRLHNRDVGVLMLLDVSESANDAVPGGDETILSLTRKACLVLAEALEKIGDPFALHAFSSDGRHDVRYQRIKDFNQPYDDTGKARLAGMTAGYSTRLGTALRHAGGFLRHLPQQKKLLLVITDGEPADVDVRDPQYLRYDARYAVDELRRAGIVTYGLSLDPYADQYVSQIFGIGRYAVVDHVERLPEKLSTLYMGLTR
ncbi:nitric oxide reductase activation protein NorD [Acidihalobacter prosperus]|uniref:Rubisco activation protein CbbO n=1 Tax=Acidihalobacter prosperus TaxID=160660 RepID=A0A1A6C0K5_9GAMM|nr:VWA domain-containing protein [Acidihalobacter prosperus]OBS08088.1 Rubisco activation protein CbbO [Acidihalobacter prosperus]